MNFNNDDDYDRNNNGMLDEVSSRHEVLAGDGHDSDGEEAIPHGVVIALADSDGCIPPLLINSRSRGMKHFVLGTTKRGIIQLAIILATCLFSSLSHQNHPKGSCRMKSKIHDRKLLHSSCIIVHFRAHHQGVLAGESVRLDFSKTMDKICQSTLQSLKLVQTTTSHT